jgi:hypothetical protein
MTSPYKKLRRKKVLNQDFSLTNILLYVLDGNSVGCLKLLRQTDPGLSVTL